MVDVCSGGKSSEEGGAAEWSYLVVGFEFGCECGCEDGTEGVWWELSGGDAMDEYGEVLDVVGVFVEMLPVLVAVVVWTRGFAWF